MVAGSPGGNMRGTIVKIFKNDEGVNIGFGVEFNYIYKQVSAEQLAAVMRQQPGCVANAELQEGKVVITNGAESKYPIQKKGFLNPLNIDTSIVLAKVNACPETMNTAIFIVADHLGKVYAYDNNALAIECVQALVANAKAVEHNGKYTVSSINGTYDIIPVGELNKFGKIYRASDKDVLDVVQNINDLVKRTNQQKEIAANTSIEVDEALSLRFATDMQNKLNALGYNTRSGMWELLRRYNIDSNVKLPVVQIQLNLNYKKEHLIGNTSISMAVISAKSENSKSDKKTGAINGLLLQIESSGRKIDNAGKLIGEPLITESITSNHTNYNKRLNIELENIENKLIDYINSINNSTHSFGNRVNPETVGSDAILVKLPSGREVASIGKITQTASDKSAVEFVEMDLRDIVDDLKKYPEKIPVWGIRSVLKLNMSYRNLGEHVTGEVIVAPYVTKELNERVYMNLDGKIYIPLLRETYDLKRKVVEMDRYAIGKTLNMNIDNKPTYSKSVEQKGNCTVTNENYSLINKVSIDKSSNLGVKSLFNLVISMGKLAPDVLKYGEAIIDAAKDDIRAVITDANDTDAVDIDLSPKGFLKRFSTKR